MPNMNVLETMTANISLLKIFQQNYFKKSIRIQNGGINVMWNKKFITLRYYVPVGFYLANIAKVNLSKNFILFK